MNPIPTSKRQIHGPKTRKSMAYYLVTGAAGFIGSRVCRHLLQLGHEVLGIDNLTEVYDLRLKNWRLSRLKEDELFRFQKVDISSAHELRHVFSSFDFDAVLNLAARAGVRPSMINPIPYYNANVLGTLNLLCLSAEFHVPKFVQASSSSLYGDQQGTPCSEAMCTDHPISPYAASKKAAEALCYAYHHSAGLDVSVLRYFTVYGPAGRPDMSPFRFVQWILEGKPVTVFGDGQQSRDFTYVDDVALGTILSLGLSGYEIINLGSNRPVDLRAFIKAIEEQACLPARLTFKPRQLADVTSTWADIRKAKALLGWEPQHSLDEGIAKTIAWYKENRDWAKQIETQEVSDKT